MTDMKKVLIIALAFVLTFSITACGQTETPESTVESNVSETTSAPEIELETESGEQTPITLTIGETVLDAYLNDSDPARSLIAQLPLTVSLNDSGNDFCGDHIDIEYSESDVTSGYQNGDLVFWPTANNFVIFVDGEEDSANTGNLVKLGRVTSPQEMLDVLEGQIDVTVALKEEAAENTEVASSAADESEGVESMQIKITVGDTEFFATLEDNATTRAWMEEMPMTLSMSDLYDREMCYRYGNGTFPTDSLRSDGYEVGDLAYWPPMGSLVILYEQNGEQFERQHLGHIDSGVEVFANTGDVDVTFEIVE